MIKILNPLVQIDHNTLDPLKITKYELCPHGGSCRNSQDRKDYPFAKDGNLLIINSPPILISKFSYKNMLNSWLCCLFIGFSAKLLKSRQMKFFDLTTSPLPTYFLISIIFIIDFWRKFIYRSFLYLAFWKRWNNYKFKVYVSKRKKSFYHYQKLMYPPTNYKNMIQSLFKVHTTIRSQLWCIPYWC